jgi:predicted  nucleic acid-binding Zn-ribbon protein
MFVRTLILSLVFSLFQQGDVPKSKGELAEQRARSEMQIGAQQDPCASCKRELAAQQRGYENLKNELAKVNRELEALRRQGGGGASGELAAARNEINSLTEKLASAEQALNTLRQQTAPLRSENARLKGENGELQNAKRDLESKLRTAENNLSELRRQSAPVQSERDALRTERDSLRGQLGEQQARLAALQKQHEELSAAANSNKATSDELAARATACTEQLEKNPGVLLDTAIASQSTTGTGAGGSGDTAIRIDGTEGKTHIIRDLVIGTLDISFDSDEVRAGHSFPLKAVFKPHPVLKPGSLQGADARNISWHIEMQYAPQRLTATYDRQQSGNKDPRRTVDATEEQTWVWQLQTAKDFESDLSDLILFAGYEMQGDSKTRDLVREPIKLAIPPGPGFFATFKDNLNWILGVIVALLTIYSGWITNRQRKQDAPTQPGGQQPQAGT